MESLWIEPRKRSTKRVTRRKTARKFKKLLEPLPMRFSPRTHVGPSVGIANHRADRDDDHINEIVNAPPIDSGVFDFVKALDQRKSLMNCQQVT